MVHGAGPSSHPLGFVVRGAVGGRWRSKDGSSRLFPWASNLICFSGLDLVGALLCNRPGTRGLTYLAIGSGDPAWDDAPPAPDRTRTSLTTEVARVPLVPGENLVYDKTAGAVRVRVTIGPGPFAQPLRELGLFGGDASPRPGSGILFNHKVHDPIDVGEGETVDREIALQLGAGLLPGARELIGLLLARQPGVAGLQFVAFGTGEATGGPPPTALAAEAMRVPLLPRAAEYDAARHAVTVSVRIGFGVGPPTVAEAGLFGGSATAAGNSGLLVDRQVFPPVDRTKPVDLQRRFVLSLVSSGAVGVPPITDRSLADARTALVQANLMLGRVSSATAAAKPAGTVVSQDPAAGAQVAEGTAVAVGVVPDRLVTVPAVLGLPVADAMAAINALGLVGSPAQSEESEAPAGTIIAVLPAPGEEVPEGAVVALTEAAARQRIVPDVRGRTPVAAAVLLQSHGFTLAPQPYPVQETAVTPGTILRQDPPGNTLQPVNRPIRITLAGPRTVPVPDLTGTTVEAAITRLADAALPLLKELGLPPTPPGLALGARSSRPAGAGETVGTVVGQDPVKGRRVPLYATVAVIIAGPIQNTVPDLSGLDEGGAAAALSGAGFALGVVAQRAYDPDEVSISKVVAQDPVAGRDWPPGGRVGITLAVPVKVPVPDLAGLEQQAAVEALGSRQLALGQVSTGVGSGATRAGAVIGQRPAAGELAPKRSAVDITLALGVPNVTGMAVKEGVTALAALGLNATSTEEESDITPGQVIRQFPEPGSVTSPGMVVQLTVAKVRTVPVPDVRGRPFGDAKAAMAAIGLQLDVVGKQESGAPEGSVVVLRPVPGTRLPSGSTVQAVIAVAPPKVVAVPELRRLTSSQAATLCNQNQLIMAIRGERAVVGVPAKTVLDQSPLPQTMVVVGSEVGVVVAALDPTVAVPELRGLTIDSARTAASRRGLSLAIGEQRLSSGPGNVVLSQDPLPGNRVPAGATVTVIESIAGVRVPGVVGAWLEDAQSQMRAAGLTTTVTRRLDNTVELGVVLSQSPTGGVLVTKGSNVALVVSFTRFVSKPIGDGTFEP